MALRQPLDDSTLDTALAEATALVSEGFAVTPLRPRSKAAFLEEWPTRVLSLDELPAYFSNGNNIGQLMGIGGAVDVDLDCAEARELGCLIFEPTRRRWGRPSAPGSHLLYIADTLPNYLKLDDPDDAKDRSTILELRAAGKQTAIPPSIHPGTGERLRYEQRGEPARVPGALLTLHAHLTAALVLVARTWPGKGSRQPAALALAGSLVRRGIVDADRLTDVVATVARIADDEEWNKRAEGARDTLKDYQDGKSTTGLPTLLELLQASEMRRVRISEWLGASSDAKIAEAPGAPIGAHAGHTTPWPILREEAFHGLAGELVRHLEPHTEADPAGLLVTTLVMFGNALGPLPHIRVQGDRHGCNLYMLQVGATSRGRKGTAYSMVRNVFERLDPAWVSDHTASGLSTAEGLLAALGNEAEGEQGNRDKRLLIFEAEFASVLKRCRQETNTLSPLLRELWDRGDARTLTRNNPLKVTGAHVSVIAHITRDELRKTLTETEQANGFANRFLFVCSRRSKRLPDGGGMPDLHNIVPRLHAALEWAKHHGDPFHRDAEAATLWREWYNAIPDDLSGLLADVTGRPEAQALRLSLLYAVLDMSPIIRREHIAAALAVWDYCEESARYIFAEATGDRRLDRLRTAVQGQPITKDEIRNVFNRNLSAADADKLIAAGQAAGWLGCREERGTGGRPRTVYYHLSALPRNTAYREGLGIEIGECQSAARSIAEGYAKTRGNAESGAGDGGGPLHSLPASDESSTVCGAGLAFVP